jgi:hypothetical protein
MSLTAKKISAVDEVGTIADGDYVPMIDISASTPAAKGVRATAAKIATYILGKYPLPSQVEAEARVDTTPRLMTVQRVAQTAAAVLAAAASGATNNWAASAAPVGTDDNTDGYAQGSIWRWSLRVWMCVDATTNIAVWVELTGSGGGGGMINPMTTAADIIIGGTAGAPARLGIGDAGQVLKVVDGAPAWATDATGEGGGMSNPMTTAGDLIVGGSAGAAGRLAKGTDGQVLKMVSGNVAWAADAEGSGSGGANDLTGVNTITNTGNFALTDVGKLCLVDATSGAITLTIPLQSSVTWVANTILRVGHSIEESNTVTIQAASGAELVKANGETGPLVLTWGQVVTIYRTGTNSWRVIASN